MRKIKLFRSRANDKIEEYVNEFLRLFRNTNNILLQYSTNGTSSDTLYSVMIYYEDTDLIGGSKSIFNHPLSMTQEKTGVKKDIISYEANMQSLNEQTRSFISFSPDG